MTADLKKDLKALDERDFGFTTSEFLAARIAQYKDVMPEEIFDLLEEASETYALLAPTLSSHLQSMARKEIEFFRSLYQDTLKKSVPNCSGC